MNTVRRLASFPSGISSGNWRIEWRQPATLTVGEVMTKEVVIALPDDDLAYWAIP